MSESRVEIIKGFGNIEDKIAARDQMIDAIRKMRELEVPADEIIALVTAILNEK